MIYSGTFLKVKDNSGAKRVQAIKIFNKSLRKGISLAGLILITIKESIMKKNSKIKKTKIQRAVVVNERQKKTRKNGSLLRTKNNGVILINSQGIPLGSRIFGFVPQELRLKGFPKILSAAKVIL
jgi:large subunit ribosomal protein L14